MNGENKFKRDHLLPAVLIKKHIFELFKISMINSMINKYWKWLRIYERKKVLGLEGDSNRSFLGRNQKVDTLDQLEYRKILDRSAGCSYKLFHQYLHKFMCEYRFRDIIDIVKYKTLTSH